MTLRRLLLVLSLLLPVGMACSDEATRRMREEHVLNRIGYGPDAWSKARIRQLGIAGYIGEQLRPELIDDGALESTLQSLYPSLGLDTPQIRVIYNEYSGGKNGGVSQPRKELQYAKAIRGVASKRQLEQVLVDFWFNHFNVDAEEDYTRWAIGPYERDAIRPHVLGRFEDMLLAVAKHPAMTDYLDNAVNFREGFVLRSRPYGINENFAREILELHTLGADAPYTLQDIQEVARVFTGWTYHQVLTLPEWGTLGFVYHDEGHDKGAKSIFGGEVQFPPGGGMEEGEELIRYLARHPRTAARIARKLCERFVSETPPASLVEDAKNVYLATNGDLREVMRTILLSSEFLMAHNHRTKVKRPFVYLTSLARALGVEDLEAWAQAAVPELRKMGEGPYEAEPPTGYPEASSAWIGDGPFLRRVNFAYRAPFGYFGLKPVERIDGDPAEVLDVLAERIAWGGLADVERSAVLSVLNGHNAANRTREAVSTLLASPAFVMH